MKGLNLLGLIIIIVVVSVLYLRYEHQAYSYDNKEVYEKIQRFLLNKDDTVNKKGIIWIWIPYKYNSRQWESFASRSSTNLNQPYQHLTIETIIKKNSNCHICLIDDTSFAKLLPNWNIDLERTPEPSQERIRLLGILKLIYHYGGLNVPSSFLCLKSFNKLLNKCNNENKPIIGESLNNTLEKNLDCVPDTRFFGAARENQIILNFINWLEREISTDFTDETTIKGNIQKYCLNEIKKNNINLIDGELLGVLDENKKIILLDDWFDKKYISLNRNCIGIFIPEDDLLKRHNYNWFCRLQPQEVLQVDNILGEYFVIATSN